MQTAEFDVKDFSVARQGDERLAIRFFTKAKQDSEKTQAAGRPIFVEVDYIQIMIPGDRNQTIVRPVTPQDMSRFNKQYEHWKAHRNNDAIIGTPLEAWNKLSLAQIEEFRYFGVRSIEQMAELRDDVCQKMPGAVDLKQKAKLFLQIAQNEAPMRKVQVELDKRDNEIETLKVAIADQAKLIKDLQENRAKK